ncbi:MAG: hypothetical protein ACRCW3_02120, partial [Metamycoplasmataceae bacterium]
TGTNVATITLKITNTEYEFSGNKDTLIVQVDETGNQIVNIDLPHKPVGQIGGFDGVLAMVNDYKAATTDNEKLTALQVMFYDGELTKLTTEKLNQFEVNVEPIVEKNGHLTLIKLTAKEGYIFNGGISGQYSTIQYTFRPIGLTFKTAGEIVDSDVDALVTSWAGGDNTTKMELLNPFFEENTADISENFNTFLQKLEIRITDTTLTIKALGVYMFDNGVGSMTFPWTS